MNFIFQHGWGFDGSFFDNLAPHFENPQILDKGYFGRRADFMHIEGEKVAISHSMGLWHLLDLEIKFDCIFALCGFEKFCHNQQHSDILLNMVDGFCVDPEAFLQNFYGRCGVKFDKKVVDFELLKQDLLWLASGDFSQKIGNQKVIFIGGKNDEILFDNSKFDFMLDCGHGLGFEKQENVANLIKNYEFSYKSNTI